jgi:PAS domain S-box-containing protein
VRDITARKQAEKEARQSQKTFAEVIERSPFGTYIVDAQFRIAMMNAASQEGAFRNVRPVIGRDFSEAMRILWPESVAAEIVGHFRHTLETGEPYYSPRFINPRHDVEIVEAYEWELHRMTLPDGQHGVICYYYDSTKLREAEAAVRSSEERLRFALESCQIGAWDIDLDDHTADRSLQHDRIFGYQEPLSSWTLDDFLRHALPEYRAEVESMVRDATARGTGWTYECQIRRADGEVRWIWFSGDRHVDNSGRHRVAGVVQDITDRKHAEIALREANERLREADLRKNEFIAILSHELRNPLAPIRYALPLLAEERLGAGGRRATAVIDRQVTHLARLVDDLLDVSRITTGKVELLTDDVALDAVLSAAVDAASPAIAAAQHSLDVAVPDGPIWIHADPARIGQAVTNLLNNSAKYTPKGGRIRLEATASDAEVVIRVVDNGVGIAPDALPTVFEMFRQVRGPNRSQGGLGIGLTLAKQFVEMHGGTIEARSGGENKGAEFVIRLPRAPARRRPEETRPEPYGQPGCLRVLVVDDNVDLVEMLAVLIEASGHQVRKAFDGRSAISAALEYHPHVVFLDVGMPDMSGIEVAKELRRHPQMAGTRIVALTGWGQAEDRHRTEEAGFDDHVTKPADPECLQRLLQRFAAEAF